MLLFWLIYSIKSFLKIKNSQISIVVNWFISLDLNLKQKKIISIQLYNNQCFKIQVGH